MNTQPRLLSNLSGEELLLMAIAGARGTRERIHQELSLRALLAEGPRRARRESASRPRLRLAKSSAA